MVVTTRTQKIGKHSVNLEEIKTGHYLRWSNLGFDGGTQYNEIIPLDLIKLDLEYGNRPREQSQDQSHITEIKSNLIKRGWDINEFPPGITKKQNNLGETYYVMVYGHHTYSALKALGVTEFVFTIYENYPDKILHDIADLENNRHYNPKLIPKENDIVHSIASACRRGDIGKTVADIKDSLERKYPSYRGKKETVISKVLRKLKLNDDRAEWGMSVDRLKHQNKTYYGTSQVVGKHGNKYYKDEKEGAIWRMIGQAIDNWDKHGITTHVRFYVGTPTQKKTIDIKRKNMITEINETIDRLVRMGIDRTKLNKCLVIEGFHIQKANERNLNRLISVKSYT